MTRRVIFVFGSNLLGAHVGGAALEALNHWDAEPGVSEGLTGDAYAIPTMDRQFIPLPLDDIELSLAAFHAFAAVNPDIQFLLTPVGTGIAGYSALEDIAPLCIPLRNVWLTGDWAQ